MKNQQDGGRIYRPRKGKRENPNDRIESDGDTALDLIVSKAINSLYYEVATTLPKKQSEKATTFPPREG